VPNPRATSKLRQPPVSKEGVAVYSARVEYNPWYPKTASEMREALGFVLPFDAAASPP
jgi:hypothetical protein